MTDRILGYPLVVSAKRKTIGIYVREGRVTIRSPKGVSAQEISTFVESKLPWIEKTLLKHQYKASTIPTLEAGCRIRILGQYRMIVRHNSSEYGLQLLPDQALFSMPENESEFELTAYAILEYWLKQLAKEMVPVKTQQFAEQLGVRDRLVAVKFRKTKSKWGHCTNQGVIQINWLIMMAPEPVIDYLVCHEVSHLLHANHSAAFWRTVESLCPDYQTHRQWLNQHAAELWLEKPTRRC
ncbi:M48 family metallopeptidase [Gynuella sunshinyii]|uniref:Putative metal-dependent hydrolase n=1 Tax=Gynuella sunshinyii YC6258 TaxID=1445510 RepID=A0A0C5V6S7_9GAMM|nr:SprT family zinc-dependent metalloprotease [Gynuella sunshinyii]AJQ95135.1 putative metal-dependent hydrolase [Gynuella sunshinyii YC6258]